MLDFLTTLQHPYVLYNSQSGEEMEQNAQRRDSLEDNFDNQFDLFSPQIPLPPILQNQVVEKIESAFLHGRPSSCSYCSLSSTSGEMILNYCKFFPIMQITDQLKSTGMKSKNSGHSVSHVLLSFGRHSLYGQKARDAKASVFAQYQMGQQEMQHRQYNQQTGVVPHPGADSRFTDSPSRAIIEKSNYSGQVQSQGQPQHNSPIFGSGSVQNRAFGRNSGSPITQFKPELATNRYGNQVLSLHQHLQQQFGVGGRFSPNSASHSSSPPLSQLGGMTSRHSLHTNSGHNTPERVHSPMLFDNSLPKKMKFPVHINSGQNTPERRNSPMPDASDLALPKKMNIPLPHQGNYSREDASGSQRQRQQPAPMQSSVGQQNVFSSQFTMIQDNINVSHGGQRGSPFSMPQGSQGQDRTSESLMDNKLQQEDKKWNV